MVQIQPFEVEEWMDRLETTPGALNIAETCCDSVSVQDLAQLAGDDTSDIPINLTSRKLTYGAIPGSEPLRTCISDVYNSDNLSSPFPIDNVVVTPGAIMANFLLFYALVGPQDHVVCVYPTYQQLYEVPKSLGADVTLWKLKEELGWLPDISELESLVKPNTKMIVINNPNNPFGSCIPESSLRDIVAFAKARNIIVLADEVYRPLFHGLPQGQKAPPSILSLGYEQTISTSSMSKAYSLAGIRVGWIASRSTKIIEAIASARNYTTIAVSQLDDQVASYALSEKVRPHLIKRNTELAQKNRDLLENFINKYAANCSWTKPVAGTTAMVQFKTKDGNPLNDGDFCLEALKETKALMMPGSVCFGNGEDFKGYMRIGYVCGTEVLQSALENLGKHIEKKYM